MFCAVFAFGERRGRLYQVSGCLQSRCRTSRMRSLSVTYIDFASMIVRINKHLEQAQTRKRRNVSPAAALSVAVVDGKR
jgi:hypothetical protein